MSRIIAMGILALLLAMIVACRPAATSLPGRATPTPLIAPTPTFPAWATDLRLPAAQRGFLMGVAGLVPRHYPKASAADWQDLYESLRLSGELFGLYQLWQDSPAQAGEVPAAVRTVCDQAARYGYRPLIALGFHRMSAKGYTPVLATAQNSRNDWGNADARAKFRQVATQVARECRPPYLALGVEVTGYYEEHPQDWENFLTAYAETYDAVKAVGPAIKVFPIFQLEAMKGKGYLTGKSRQPMWSLLGRFEPRLDLAAFTTYPFLDYKTPADIPAGYLAEIQQYTPRDIAITELAWPSALPSLLTEKGTRGEAGWLADEQAQADFALRFLELAKEVPVEFAVWTLPHDPAPGVLSGSESLFAAIGLKQNDGAPKRVWWAWRRIVVLPKGDVTR